MRKLSVLQLLGFAVGFYLGLSLLGGAISSGSGYFYGVLGLILIYGSVLWLAGGISQRMGKPAYRIGLVILGAAVTIYGVAAIGITSGNYVGTGGGAVAFGVAHIVGFLLVIVGIFVAVFGYALKGKAAHRRVLCFLDRWRYFHINLPYRATSIERPANGFVSKGSKRGS